MAILTNNYLKYYNSIVSQTKEIDIYLKTSELPLKANEIAAILKISELEVCQIVEVNELGDLNTYNFHLILENGSSAICKVYKRLKERGIPTLYSSEDIAYIYDIDEDEVRKALLSLGKKQVNESLFPLVFKKMSN